MTSPEVTTAPQEMTLGYPTLTDAINAAMQSLGFPSTENTAAVNAVNTAATQGSLAGEVGAMLGQLGITPSLATNLGQMANAISVSPAAGFGDMGYDDPAIANAITGLEGTLAGIDAALSGDTGDPSTSPSPAAGFGDVGLGPGSSTGDAGTGAAGGET